MNQMNYLKTGVVATILLMLTGCGSSDSNDSYSEIEKIWSHDCQIEANERFVYTADAQLIDTLTCLEWQYLPEAGYKPYVTQESYEKGDYSNTTGDTAQSTCEILGEGWRLPTKYEVLSAIIDIDADLSSIPYRGEIPDSLYNKENFFTGATWTSTAVSGHKEYRWYVEFLNEMAQTDSNLVNLPSFEVFCVKDIED